MLLPALQVWLEARPTCLHDRVFTSTQLNPDGDFPPLRPDGFNDIVTLLKQEAQIPQHVKITPHALRRTFATEVAKAGNPFALRDLLGRSDIKTTEVYVSVDDRELKRVAGFAPSLGGDK